MLWFDCCPKAFCHSSRKTKLNLIHSISHRTVYTKKQLNNRKIETFLAEICCHGDCLSLFSPLPFHRAADDFHFGAWNKNVSIDRGMPAPWVALQIRQEENTMPVQAPSPWKKSLHTNKTSFLSASVCVTLIMAHEANERRKKTLLRN